MFTAKADIFYLFLIEITFQKNLYNIFIHHTHATFYVFLFLFYFQTLLPHDFAVLFMHFLFVK